MIKRNSPFKKKSLSNDISGTGEDLTIMEAAANRLQYLLQNRRAPSSSSASRPEAALNYLIPSIMQVRHPPKFCHFISFSLCLFQFLDFRLKKVLDTL